MTVQANYGTGRRKTATARVFLTPGEGNIVVNASKLVVTGNKAQDKMYWHHTGFPGGIKGVNYTKLATEKPTLPLEIAVRGMLPKGPLGYAMIKKLKVYSGTEHPHTAQQPQVLDI